MPRRAKGYSYAVGKDGRKHRVYASGAAKAAYKARKGKSTSKAVIRGKGAYQNGPGTRSPNFWEFLTEVPNSIKPFIGPAMMLAGSGAYNWEGPNYKVAANSFISEGQSPASVHSKDSSITVRHREYIGNVISSATANAFQNTAYNINPALGSIFPWLSAIAEQYQEWKPLGMLFEFKTLSADAISSSQANMTIGGVIMATNYNSIDPLFTSKVQMDNTQYTTSCKPSASFYHPIECNPRANPLGSLYTRSGAQPAGTDLRMYDLGLFQVASFGIAATSVTLGELWITYDIQLSKPISTAAQGQDVLTDVFFLGSPSTTNPLGSSQTTFAYNSIGGYITSNSGYNWPSEYTEGVYLLVLEVAGTVAADMDVGISTTLTKCAGQGLWDSGDYSATGNYDTSVYTAFYILCAYLDPLPDSAGCRVTYAASALPTGTVYGTLVVTQMDSTGLNSILPMISEKPKLVPAPAHRVTPALLPKFEEPKDVTSVPATDDLIKSHKETVRIVKEHQAKNHGACNINYKPGQSSQVDAAVQRAMQQLQIAKTCPSSALPK